MVDSFNGEWLMTFS